MHIYFNKSFNEKFDFNTILTSQFGKYLLLAFINTKIMKNIYSTYLKLHETYKNTKIFVCVKNIHLQTGFCNA
jgi:hypothetical protein